MSYESVYDLYNSYKNGMIKKVGLHTKYLSMIERLEHVESVEKKWKEIRKQNKLKLKEIK